METQKASCHEICGPIYKTFNVVMFFYFFKEIIYLKFHDSHSMIKGKILPSDSPFCTG